MSTIKSSAENLTLNADGANNDVIIQSNASTKVTVDGQNSRVGIGITSPSSELHVYGGAGANVSIQSSAGSHWKLGDAVGSSNGNFVIYDYTNSAKKVDIMSTGMQVANGILFNSDSAAANALDDYEEGTWTPALSGSATAGSPTYWGQTGHYTKIGRVVHIMGNLHTNNLVDLDGDVWVTGLPFTTHGYDSAINFGYAASMGITAGESIVGNTGASTTKFKIHIWNSTAGTGSLDDAEFTNGCHLVFSGTYHT